MTTTSTTTTTTTVLQVQVTTTTTIPVVSNPAPTPVVVDPSSLYPSGDPMASLPPNVQAAFHCIMSHESGGDPGAVNSSSGAGGLYQFLPSSWIAYGGGQFASLPNLASAVQQDQIAFNAYQQSGFSPWEGNNSCWN